MGLQNRREQSNIAIMMRLIKDILFLIIGFNVQWPTFPTLIMAPILILMYLRLVRIEDRELAEEFGTAFEVYRKRVPAFMPKVIIY